MHDVAAMTADANGSSATLQKKNRNCRTGFGLRKNMLMFTFFLPCFGGSLFAALNLIQMCHQPVAIFSLVTDCAMIG
jgi:hypothetical protein